MSKQTTCFFTGHRRISKRTICTVREKIDEKIENMIKEKNIDTFINGGAIGFDFEAAESVIKIREKYPNIKLIMYLPCYNQSEMWSENDKKRYTDILKNADKKIYVTKGTYTKECMRMRNMQMIKNSSYCIAFCLLENSGTGFTVRSAENVGIEVENIADEIY